MECKFFKYLILGRTVGKCFKDSCKYLDIIYKMEGNELGGNVLLFSLIPK